MTEDQNARAPSTKKLGDTAEIITDADEITKEVIPEEAIPEEIIPEEAIPEETVAVEANPEEVIPEKAKPEETVPEDAAPMDVTPEEANPADASETVSVEEDSSKKPEDEAAPAAETPEPEESETDAAPTAEESDKGPEDTCGENEMIPEEDIPEAGAPEGECPAEEAPEKEIPEMDAPKEAAPEEAVPEEAAAEGNSPGDVPSEDDSPQEEAQKDIPEEISQEKLPDEIGEKVSDEERLAEEPVTEAALAAEMQEGKEPETEAAPAAEEPEAKEPEAEAAPAAEEPKVKEPETKAAPAAEEPEAKEPETPDGKKEPVPPSVPPPEPPEVNKKKCAVLIAVVAAIIAAGIIAVVLYIQYFVPREIHVSEASLDLWVGDTAKLSYSIVPSSADNLEVAWVSSNDEIASIDEFGVVTAKAGGKCAIAVATGNGKTDICVVSVTDPAQVQKESLNKVKDFVGSLKTTTSADGNEVYNVENIDDTHSFQIGTEDNNLLLIYRTTGQMEEFGVDAVYTTTVKLSPENIDTAEVIQNDTLYVYGFPISMIGTGSMNLASYQHGDQVPLTTTSSTVEGLDASDALHELTDRGSMICIDKFETFLEKNGFDFSLGEFGFKNFGSLEKAPEPEENGENTLTAAEAQESWNEIQEGDVLSDANTTAETEAGGNAEDSAAVSVGEVAFGNRTVPGQATVQQEEPAITPFPSCRPGFSFEALEK